MKPFRRYRTTSGVSRMIKDHLKGTNPKLSLLKQEERLMLDAYAKLTQQRTEINRRIREIAPNIKVIVKSYFPEGVKTSNGYVTCTEMRIKKAPCNFDHVFESIAEFMLTKKFMDTEALSKLFAHKLTTFIFEKLDKQTKTEYVTCKRPKKRQRAESSESTTVTTKRQRTQGKKTKTTNMTKPLPPVPTTFSISEALIPNLSQSSLSSSSSSSPSSLSPYPSHDPFWTNFRSVSFPTAVSPTINMNPDSTANSQDYLTTMLPGDEVELNYNSMPSEERSNDKFSCEDQTCGQTPLLQLLHLHPPLTPQTPITPQTPLQFGSTDPEPLREFECNSEEHQVLQENKENNSYVDEKSKKEESVINENVPANTPSKNKTVGKSLKPKKDYSQYWKKEDEDHFDLHKQELFRMTMERLKGVEDFSLESVVNNT